MAPVYADHPFQLIPDPRPEGINTKNDIFDNSAVEMTAIHNCFIRGINAIYLQAPHVKPQEVKAFANYAALWAKMVHIHHHEEETQFFPIVEKMAGEPGLMATNVAQHHEFHDGLEKYTAYVHAVAAGKEPYDGNALRAIIDAFGGVFIQHLTEEITTLMGLRKYGAERFKDYPAECAKLGKQAIASAGATTGIIFVFTCLDVHFEDGRWAAFPPMPWIVVQMFRYVQYWFHTDWWKFGPCDRLGNMRPLYAVPAE
ncbi:uncharacterized protein SPSK_01902 [Sporothrix schenckii 1099-18]|uniref:Hemerythrin-like domain-containing protein n=2 Tax=Sporothrix schenckii TaxID=29908 RepID=U7PKP0_SPOS1|nr:uncharacterized protein SPSK_01902 [Sporothrix schenckii 1099-18]ERS96218.1 hypothetical protein HMPREF1624_07127 [Sporothrix schenckii ATCC 58251]KJR86901.1 hypothetical protein SPSK_01902 [Sporothrix schenckii 1099-18]